ncbi:g11888 [Coccomyxa viridis]|uniref:G11888 protein n=1 Tax=Coccomyxa viridis TaxID=1274662 RepID=A0ABP1GBN6_9CHLO
MVQRNLVNSTEMSSSRVDLSAMNPDDAPLLRAGQASSSTAQHALHEGRGIFSKLSARLWLLTFCSGIAGFLFGYDTGVISGALPYIRDDLLKSYQSNTSSLNWIQGVIVSAAVFGAAAGSALGGALGDFVGRKKTLLVGDALFAAGALLMAAAQGVGTLIAGRLVVGLGVGLASVTSPVYIAESAPPSVRATLVTMNVLMITGGQFVAYVADFIFTFAPGTWRWMLGVAALPAVLQAVGMLFLPESPRWLLAHGATEEGERALRELVQGPEYDQMMADLREQAAEQRKHAKVALRKALVTPELRRQLHIGVGLQVLQQLAGINTVMYFTPAILELAGIHDKRLALLVALAPAGVNALGTVAGMLLVDRCGRRKLLLWSLVGVTAAMLFLGGAFRLAEMNSPPVALDNECPAFEGNTCTDCIRQGCSFCSPTTGAAEPGACISREGSCDGWLPSYEYSAGCPSPYTAPIIAGLLIYLAAFAPGVGPVPWAVNAELYPQQMRGLGSGAAATANWLTNAVVSHTFLPLTQAVGGSGAFWIYASITACGTAWAYIQLPETKGLSLEAVQELFRQ